ncbi:SGNH/GDSL hydrolase family protein [Streptomyces sp. NPDC059002]|uniref:SGNH/GDSL hydrolase family protein n=1 Tax=Streptomyces sp. NPDC059002 TaxID=3346690 RepID=UPI0036CA1C6C
MSDRSKRAPAPLKRYELTPQMRDYDEFNDAAQRRYLPYLMYFGRGDFSSQAIRTDRAGFRISTGPDGIQASAAGHVPPGPVRILTGGSTALGVGATGDASTLSSLLWSRYAPSEPWLNFAGHCFNPTQEALLFTLYRHLLGNVSEVVIYSGVNAMMLARLPEWQQGDHGAFFFCGEYFEKMEELREQNRGPAKRFGRRTKSGSGTPAVATFDDVRRDITTVIGSATEMTLRQLDVWRRMAGPETRITYVLQPMSRWMRQTSTPQETVLFEERDRIYQRGVWEELYGDVATPEVAKSFAAELRAGCEKQGVRFFDLNPVFADATTEDDWLFVDRVHYNDMGHDIAARIMAEELELS